MTAAGWAVNVWGESDISRSTKFRSHRPISKLFPAGLTVVVVIYPDFSYIPGYPGDDWMIRVSSTEFGKEVGRYQDAALSQPVVVTRNGRDRTVMISAEEYARLKRRDRDVFSAGELPDETITAIRDARMDARHAQLDDLIKDWNP